MSQVPTARSHLLLADTPNAVGWARRHTRDVLSRWQVPPDLIDSVLLVVSELATNAVRHPAAKQPEKLTSAVLSKVQTFALDLQLHGRAVVVQVADHDPQPPVLQHVGEEAEGGRGIFLVEHMSSRWGHYQPPGGGKVVWAELRLGMQKLAAPSVTVALRPTSNRTGRPRPFKPITDEQLAVDDPQLMGRVLVGLRGL
ncbi:ATP-binding protein [Kitasatospora sp. NPDC096147]|uniref:ATP-binding protein n=1 Tax=Kitasatospora sp. NPDC096147 TaxID=3364093 RepID=UPI00382540E5